MIDLSPLDKYVLDDVNYCITEASKRIEAIGFDSWFEKQLSTFLNCSKLSDKNTRLVQTNFISYKYEITTTICMIEKYADNKDYYYEKLLLQHNNNLEFEAINGFEYDGKTTNKKATRRRSKQTSLSFDNKPEKETVAERKLKAHIAKIKSLNIVLKPVKNDNSL